MATKKKTKKKKSSRSSTPKSRSSTPVPRQTPFTPHVVQPVDPVATPIAPFNSPTRLPFIHSSASIRTPTAIDITTMPCIIREILFAPPCPSDDIAKLLEVALTYHNSSLYQLAIQTYVKAQQLWIDLVENQQGGTMQIFEIVYFRLAIGGVYQSLANDEMALSEFMEAMRYAETGLPVNHPDRALAYSAIGSVYVHMNQISLAKDYYVKCLQARKELLGDQHVDTAVAKNNLAVCWHLANRMNVALELYEDAFKVFKQSLGLSHPRTNLVQRNIGKAKTRSLQDFVFEIPKFEPIKIPVGGKKKTAAKKKKKKAKK